ncbi:MAG: hypothetical protein QME94_14195 [Anaerolineae bacterium]|nr:hypothetical protein [Anaerolineae bacterium]
MDPYLVLAFVLLVFVLLQGALNLLRREPLSGRQVGESLLVGAVILAVAWLAQAPPPAVLFFVVLYLVAMRARIVVDIANALAQRGRAEAASRLYDVALRLATVPLDRLIVLANKGAALLYLGRVEEAVRVFEGVLAVPAALGVKLEAACRCNLGLAYLRQGRTGLGRGQLHETVDLFPGSVYARRAQLALQRLEAQEPPGAA